MQRITPFLFVSSILLFTFISCHKPLYITERHHTSYRIDNDVPVDTEMVKMLRPYKAGVDTQMQVVIGRTDIPLTKSQPESTIGNFLADAQLEAAKRIDRKVVAAVANYGGIRTSYIAPGPITREKIYDLMPFDNMITIVEVPGNVLQQFCDHMATAKGWPVAGVTFLIRDKKAIDIKVMDEPLNEHIIYKIAVNDYIANGGDRCDFLQPLQRKNTGIKVRDALIDYITRLERQNTPLHPNIEKRVTYAE